MKKLSTSLALLTCASTLFASGYRIPEQSSASIAKSGANIASAKGAGTAYHNPANMSFLQNGSYLETSLTYINLPSIKYEDKDNPKLNSNSEVENFIAPTAYYVSPVFADKFRFGLSFVVPAGLAKRWEDPYAKMTAEEFSIKILELNPNVSYKILDNLSVAFGARMTYTEGVVKSDMKHKDVSATFSQTPGKILLDLSRDLHGDSVDFGYNLALAYKPLQALNLSATYRSKIDLSIEGSAALKYYLKISGVMLGIANEKEYKGSANITIPLPAVFDLALAYDFGKTQVELSYERTFWSSYDNLDFGYEKDFSSDKFFANFDKATPKNWKDVNSYRLGISYDYSDKLELMGGFAYDETPIKDDKYVGFELPDSNALLFSFGGKYDLEKHMSLALSYLYDKKEKRTITQRSANPATLNGTFKDASAHLLNIALEYRF